MAQKEHITLKDVPPTDELKEKNLARLEKQIQSGKTPHEAEMYMEQTKNQVRTFLKHHLKLIEPQDQKLIQNSTQRILNLGFLCGVPAFGINLVMGNLARGKFYKYSFLKRLTIRTVVFALPYALVYKYASSNYSRLSLYLEEKYAERVNEYLKTGDPKSINPSNE